MNLRGGWALIRFTWSSWLQHRSFFFVLAFGWMLPPLVYLFVWSTAATAQPVQGMTRGAFVAYYLTLIVVNQLTYAQTNWTVGDLIREGKMSTLLLRPLSPIFDALATEVAGKVVFLAFVLPLTALLALILKPELSLTPQALFLFFPALFLAWLLRFLWGYWLALLAFWATRADALLALQNALIFLLAGQVAPLRLLPAPLRQAAFYLPFRYMVAFPVELLTGQLTLRQAAFAFCTQLIWLGATLLLFTLLWRRGLRHYAAIGG